ncbi:MAG: hypothetical protein LBQ35_02855 [Spirochaetaceae bacterium]|jgi:hypothetical protein|nr:hypothetical protein [Spirochaetaceae bacterium]
MTPSFFISAAALVVSCFSFLFLLRYLRRRTGEERILAEFRDEIDGMITELNEATVRDETLVEQRIRTLRALLEDTDRRIATYVRELERRQAQAAALDESGLSLAGEGDSGAEEKPPAAPRPPATPPEAPAGGPFQAAPAAAPPPGEVHPRIRRAARQIIPSPKPFAERAMELYRAGLSPGLIASKLGVTVTEVELTVTLAKRKGSAQEDPGPEAT